MSQSSALRSTPSAMRSDDSRSTSSSGSQRKSSLKTSSSRDSGLSKSSVRWSDHLVDVRPIPRRASTDLDTHGSAQAPDANHSITVRHTNGADVTMARSDYFSGNASAATPTLPHHKSAAITDHHSGNQRSTQNIPSTNPLSSQRTDEYFEPANSWSIPKDETALYKDAKKVYLGILHPSKPAPAHGLFHTPVQYLLPFSTQLTVPPAEIQMRFNLQHLQQAFQPGLANFLPTLSQLLTSTDSNSTSHYASSSSTTSPITSSVTDHHSPSSTEANHTLQPTQATNSRSPSMDSNSSIQLKRPLPASDEPHIRPSKSAKISENASAVSPVSGTFDCEPLGLALPPARDSSANSVTGGHSDSHRLSAGSSSSSAPATRMPPRRPLTHTKVVEWSNAIERFSYLLVQNKMDWRQDEELYDLLVLIDKEKDNAYITPQVLAKTKLGKLIKDLSTNKLFEEKSTVVAGRIYKYWLKMVRNAEE